MVIDTPGKVTDRILLLGKKESNVYLLKAEDEYALIGGGMIHIAPHVIEQLIRFRIDETLIKRIIILHAHFDHCGLVPFLKRRWPWARVTASSRANDLLSTPAVINTIKSMNQGIFAMFGDEKKSKEMDFECTEINVEDIVKEGDILPCGNLSIEILEVPGHSSCSIAAYVPEDKAMFASDAGGIPLGDQIFAAGNSNFDKFQSNLERMAEFDIEIHLAEHGGAFTGEDGREFLNRSIESAQMTRELIVNSFKRTMDEQKTVDEITDFFTKGTSDYFLSKDVISLVVGQMVRFFSKKLSGEKA